MCTNYEKISVFVQQFLLSNIVLPSLFGQISPKNLLWICFILEPKFIKSRLTSSVNIWKQTVYLTDQSWVIFKFDKRKKYFKMKYKLLKNKSSRWHSSSSDVFWKVSCVVFSFQNEWWPDNFDFWKKICFLKTFSLYLTVQHK